MFTPSTLSTTTLTEQQRADYTVKLNDALTAYHQLMTGQQVRVILDQNGERVEFTASSRSNLYSYIISLQSILGVPRMTVASPARPAQFIF